MSGTKSPKRKSRKLQLIVSAEETPSVQIRPGMKMEVFSVELVKAEDLLEPLKAGARLCGGSGTCLAIIDLEGMVSLPAPFEE